MVVSRRWQLGEHPNGTNAPIGSVFDGTFNHCLCTIPLPGFRCVCYDYLLKTLEMFTRRKKNRMLSAFQDTVTADGRAVMCNRTSEGCDAYWNRQLNEKLQQIQMELLSTKREVEHLRGLQKTVVACTPSPEPVPDYLQFWFEDSPVVHPSRTTKSRMPRFSPYKSIDECHTGPPTPDPVLWVCKKR
jgi:hypothetical protein